MSRSRVITNIPRVDVPFVIAMITADGGSVVSQLDESDGEVTLIATFPDDDGSNAADDVADAVIEGAAGQATGGAPRWMDVARRELAAKVSEKKKSNPRIEEYHATTSGGTATDAVPWCSSFVNFCVSEAGQKGTNSKSARSWMTWGRDAGGYVEGAIIVLQRGNPPSGHVGFCIRASAGRVLLLGGNQSDRVSEMYYDTSRVIARRVHP